MYMCVLDLARGASAAACVACMAAGCCWLHACMPAKLAAAGPAAHIIGDAAGGGAHDGCGRGAIAVPARVPDRRRPRQHWPQVSAYSFPSSLTRGTTAWPTTSTR
jgi:hypothetical protein